MSTTRTTSSLSGTIPELSDSANIVTAFNSYHDSLANTSTGVAVLARSTNTFTGDIAVNGGDITTTATTFNLIDTNATTLNLGRAATSIVMGATTGTTAVRNDLALSAGKVFIFEGATNDANETRLTVVDPTADRTITFPNLDGTVALVPSILVLGSTVTDSISTTSSTTKTSAALGKYFSATASTAYKVDFSVRVYQNINGSGGNGDSSIYFRFALPSGATIGADLNYRIDKETAETSVTDAISVYEASDISILIDSVSNASDTGYSVISGSGIIRVGATAGNIGPTIYLTASNLGGPTSTASFTTSADSYCIVERIGTTGEINTGGWA
jgi:hypothetical protein